MSSTTLYIPKTITVGFQNRTDTFTGKLAYVIYTDHTGKLRKEGSWNSWRNKNIEPITVDNVPTPNFTLNKGVQRSREWFGTGRSMVRVWDPRDFEFEISVDNLLNVLMHADVSKRDITEQCVYAWEGTNLVLLPINSVEYEESVKHTAKQSVKFSSKDLIVGHTYTVRKENNAVVYLGRFPRYQFTCLRDGEDSYHSLIRGYESSLKKDKYHTFIDPVTREILPKDPSSFISGPAVQEIHSDFATLMDHYFASVESQPVAGMSLVTFTESDSHYSNRWTEVGDGVYAQLSIDEHKGTASILNCLHFSDKTNAIQASHTGCQPSNNWYNRSTVVPPRSLQDVVVSSDRLSTIAADVSATYQQFIADNTDAGSYYNYYKYRGHINQMLSEKHSVGKLVPTMADGRVCHNFTF